MGTKKCTPHARLTESIVASLLQHTCKACVGKPHGSDWCNNCHCIFRRRAVWVRQIGLKGRHLSVQLSSHTSNNTPTVPPQALTHTHTHHQAWLPVLMPSGSCGLSCAMSATEKWLWKHSLWKVCLHCITTTKKPALISPLHKLQRTVEKPTSRKLALTHCLWLAKYRRSCSFTTSIAVDCGAAPLLRGAKSHSVLNWEPADSYVQTS